MAYLKLFELRHALSISIAVLLAFIVNHYVSFGQEYWMFLTALLVGQTSKGTPIKQGLMNVVAVIAAIMIASLLTISEVLRIPSLVLLMGLFVLGGYISFLNQAELNKRFYLVIYFSLMFLFAILSPINTMEAMQNRFLDVVFGGLIGLACALWIFPVKFEEEFRASVLPILNSLLTCLDALLEHFFQPKKLPFLPWTVAPEWVYETGFNPGLRSGFRFFLVHLSRLAELFSSLRYLASQPVDEDILHKIGGDITHSLQKNRELITILIDYFANKKVGIPQADFTSDIAQLEKTLQNLLPENIEFLNISPQYMTLTAYVRDIKDMRQLLLQLVMSLAIKNT